MRQDTDPFVAELDPVTARAVHDLIDMYGEHYAAGGPIGRLDPGADEALGRLLKDLNIHFGGTGRSA